MSKGRILAVDDEHFFRVLYEDLLGGEGYAVTTAEDGARALELLDTETFDVVIMDVIMPGEDGVRVAERIKDKWPALEILFITSLRDVKVATSAMQRGASDFLTKPINPDELLAVIMRLFERRAVVEEHTRLLDENVYFLDSLGVYQRGLRIMEKLDPDELCEAILERLTAETSAQGGALWLAREEKRNRLKLQSVRGLVVPDQEPGEISWSDHPSAELLKQGKPFFATDAQEAPDSGEPLRDRNTLFVPVLEEGEPVLLVRLTDKVGGNQFADEDLRKARLLEQLFLPALRNARAYTALARRSPKDDRTRAWDMDFFNGYIEAELQKSHRFKRKFSLLALRITNYADLRKRYDAKALREHADTVVLAVSGAVREIDLIGRLQDDEFYVLLPETDYFASLSLKKRISEALAESSRRGPAPLNVALAAVTYPGDGDSAKLLFHALRTGLLREQVGLDARRDGSADSHWDFVATLLASKKPGFPERERRGIRPENSTIRKGRFSMAFFIRLQECLVEEIGRDPHVNGITYVGLGELDREEPMLAARSGEERPATRIYAIGAPLDSSVLPGDGWAAPVPVSDDHIRNHRFILFLSEDSAYAFYGRLDGEALQGFHTSDKGFVESLIFKLQEEYDLQSHI